ncbi:flagellar biosynthetic protein FliO [Massilia sp. Mn16-1_5]|uniref:flagellar biosynthetic protein FliO n=1 Tax=Massilia sp. Mn16-1_5 TaxID=2079199 RepID=UPI001E3F4DB7|nr:flagellar biosynthetic protein FliO [Massilia sp. Mn16-1_5]
MIASIFLMPLAACAVQPAAPNAAPPQATPATSQPSTPAPAPAARQEEAGTGRQADTAAPAAAPAPAPQRATSRPAASPPVTPNTPVAERATTVGEVPTVGATTPTPTPGVATMPGAPAAVPGTPANPNTPVTVGQAAPGPSTGTLLQTILALVLVLALLAGLAWAAKRYGPRVAGNSANLRMVGALNIGGRERIMVVEVGDQWIVVGASPGRVNALATMPKGDAAASATLAGHAPSANSFSDWLKQTIDKRNAK